MELCPAVEPVLVLASAKALYTIEIKQGDWSASCVEHEGWQLQLVFVPTAQAVKLSELPACRGSTG